MIVLKVKKFVNIYKMAFVSVISNCLKQCLSQDLKTGCLKLAIVKILANGCPIFKGDHNIFIFQA